MAFLPKFLQDKFVSSSRLSEKPTHQLCGLFYERYKETYVDPRHKQVLSHNMERLEGHQDHPMRQMLYELNKMQLELALELEERSDKYLEASSRWGHVKHYGQMLQENPQMPVDLTVYHQLLQQANLASRQAEELNQREDNKAILTKLNHAAQAMHVVQSLAALPLSEKKDKREAQMEQMKQVTAKIGQAINHKDLSMASGLLQNAHKQAFEVKQKITKPSFFKRLFAKQEKYTPMVAYQPPIKNMDKSISTKEANDSVHQWLDPLEKEHENYLKEIEKSKTLAKQAGEEVAAMVRAKEKIAEEKAAKQIEQSKALAKQAGAEAAVVALKKQEIVQEKIKLEEAIRPSIKQDSSVQESKESVFQTAYINALRDRVRKAVLRDKKVLEPSNKAKLAASFIGAAFGAADLAGTVASIGDKVIDLKNQKDKAEAAQVVNYFMHLPADALEEHVIPAIRELQGIYKEAIARIPAAQMHKFAGQMVSRFINNIKEDQHNISLSPKDQMVVSARTGSKRAYLGKSDVRGMQDEDTMTVQGYLDRAVTEYEGKRYGRLNDPDQSKHARPKYPVQYPTEMMARMCDLNDEESRKVQFTTALTDHLIRSFKITPSYYKDEEHNEQIDQMLGLEESPLVRTLFDVDQTQFKRTPASIRVEQSKLLAQNLYEHYRPIINQVSHSVNPAEDDINTLAKCMAEDMQKAMDSKEFHKWLADTRVKTGKEVMPFEKALYALELNKSKERVIKLDGKKVSSQAVIGAIKAPPIQVIEHVSNNYMQQFKAEFTSQIHADPKLSSLYSEEDIHKAASEVARRYEQRMNKLQEPSVSVFVRAGVQRALDWVGNEKDEVQRKTMTPVEQLVRGVELGKTKKTENLHVVGHKDSKLNLSKTNWSTEENIFTNSSDPAKVKKYGVLPPVDNQYLEHGKREKLNVSMSMSASVVGAGIEVATDIIGMASDALSVGMTDLTEVGVGGVAAMLAVRLGKAGYDALQKGTVKGSDHEFISSLSDMQPAAAQSKNMHYWQERVAAQKGSVDRPTHEGEGFAARVVNRGYGASQGIASMILGIALSYLSILIQYE